MALYKLFVTLHLPGALGLAVITMTSLIRLILHPLTLSQLKSAHKMNKLKPHIDALGKKHKDDKVKLQQAQMQLYKEAGINPAAGCLPLLLQMPILIALYNVFFQVLSNNNLPNLISDINKVIYLSFLKIETLDLSFFGLNLASKPSEWQTSGFILLAVPVITGVLQYIQTKMMIPQTQTTNNKQQITTKDKDNKTEDMGMMMQKQMSIMMPLMIGFFAYSFPLGLSLYWNTFTVFGIIEQKNLQKHLKKENG
ncbi:hypothetical protein A3D03_00270 [Candidatus Gottesmanbacteria bacterium RIFCSPHIGHO2_02_FULL_40_13]|uniref:Membrane insertase YidC/Oxa/ALB C-terminal domain-containing protein n=1 Tax=Candidatus Gottesmanbacteria bacterium RIFCSPHIGHO2_02_FULL_40_13 TaxID=1798384 RepID=A0A1F6AE63_9BACT|nr:MAG: hypothetical protein A3D03_00270 [Candidatus Gottesmanbacteria bacterium RIFCSPHIGHO2_02_FULL_40_13]